MAKEDKELLLKYLCMALPYGVKVLNTAEDLNEICELDSIMTSRKHDKVFVGLTLPDDAIMTGVEMVKPYLRPMSNMTKEEREEMYNLLSPEGTAIYDCDGISMPMNHYGEFVSYEFMNRIIQYLLKNHFDFMGLIPKDLAIEITKENNPYKN